MPRHPVNSFFLFCLDERPKVQQQMPHLSNSEVTSRLGESWRDLDKRQKAQYKKKYEENKKVCNILRFAWIYHLTSWQRFYRENPGFRRNRKQESQYTSSFRLSKPASPKKVTSPTASPEEINSYDIYPTASFNELINGASSQSASPQPTFFRTNLDLYINGPTCTTYNINSDFLQAGRQFHTSGASYTNVNCTIHNQQKYPSHNHLHPAVSAQMPRTEDNPFARFFNDNQANEFYEELSNYLYFALD